MCKAPWPESRASGGIHRDGAVNVAGTAHTGGLVWLSDPNQSAQCDLELLSTHHGQLLRAQLGRCAS